MKLRPSTDEAIKFLKHLKPTGPWDLVAIGQDGQVTARTFFVNEAQEAFAWIEARQGRANLYYHVNTLKPGIHHRKAKKADIDTATSLHVDIDNPNALEILRTAGLPPPTVTVFSGGGYQPLWRLDPACSNITRVERANLALARRLGGDKCHNPDRLLRIPGTVNIPNAKKRANGRTEIVAAIVSEFTDWKRAYSIDGLLELATGPTTLHTVDESSVSIFDIEGLPPSVLQATKNLILNGDDPHNPIGSATARYPSRSEVVYRVAWDLARAGCSGEVIAGILINPQYGISASIREKANPAKYAARQAAAVLDAVGTDWPDTTKGGFPKGTFRNAMLAIRRLGLYCDNDEFHKRKSIGGHLLQTFQGELSDDGCAILRQEIIRAFGFDPTKVHTREAANTLCLENTYHPIQDYLRSLTWDGVPRVETWLSKYLSAEDNRLNRAIGKIMLTAAVRRVREPGVKFDTIVVLEGPQGTGKSTALKILAGGDRNFSDQEILALTPREQMELLEGVWIYEISELEGISRADTGKVKAFASRSVDRGRPAYGYFKENRPRQCILIGTTNDRQYLRDPTGNRRFLPVATGAIDLVALERDRDQLWAEAALLEEAGHSLILPEELWPVAQIEQDARLEDDPWLEVLGNISGRVSGAVERIGTSDLLSDKLQIPPERQQQYHLKRLAAVMQKLGWKGPIRIKMSGRVVRGYERPAPRPNQDQRDFF